MYIFDGQDQLVRKFGSSGSGNGQFYNPYGLAFDADNHLYVSEWSNHRVQKLSIDGGHLLQIGYQGSEMVNFSVLLVLQYTMTDCILLSTVIVVFQCFSLMVNSVALLGQDS